MALGDTTELLEDIRARGSIPSADLRFPDAALLRAASLELREGIAPLLHNAKAEHMVYEYSAAVTSGNDTLRMPSRAIGGGGLRDVTWQQSSSDIQISLREVPASEAPAWGNTNGMPTAYYVRNYSIVLLPKPNASGTVYMPYYARPNTLAPVADAFRMDNTGLLTSGNTAFSGTNADAIAPGDHVDIIRGSPSFETLATDVEVIDQNPSYLLLAGNVVLDTAAGDFICATGTSPVVQAPLELNGLLAVRTVRRCLKAVGDERWQDFDADVQELEARAVQWLSPRNDGESKAASPVNSGLLRGVMRTYIR